MPCGFQQRVLAVLDIILGLPVAITNGHGLNIDRRVKSAIPPLNHAPPPGSIDNVERERRTTNDEPRTLTK
jgi:hypothetical protein